MRRTDQVRMPLTILISIYTDMKKESLLTTLVILLLIMNIGIVTFLVMHHEHERPPHPGGPPHVDRLIIETLKFDDEQKKKFEVMKHEHHEQMMRIDEEYKNVLEKYFSLLNDEKIKTVEKDSLEKEIGRLQLSKATVTLEHFRQLKALCKPEQQKHFQELIPELTKIILPHPPRDLPPPREGN